jgi:hypothetical protein
MLRLVGRNLKLQATVVFIELVLQYKREKFNLLAPEFYI